MRNNRYKVRFENLVSAKLLLFMEYYFSITFPIFSSDIFVYNRCIVLGTTGFLKHVPILAPKPVLRTQLEEATWLCSDNLYGNSTFSHGHRSYDHLRKVTR